MKFLFSNHFKPAAIVLILLYSCSEEKPHHVGIERARDSIIQSRDTIVGEDGKIYIDINLDSINYLDSIKNHDLNSRLEKLEGENLIKYLRSISLYRFDEWEKASYNWNYNTTRSIPYVLYRKLFPDSTYYFKKVQIKKGENLRRHGDTLIRRFGTLIDFQPKYFHFSSFLEKPEYIQLIATTDGKYTYNLDLLTFSKPDLKLISVLPIYWTFIDAGQIDYLCPKFSKNKDTVTLKYIFNHPIEYEEADSTYNTYYINPKGKIIKLKTKKYVNAF